MREELVRAHGRSPNRGRLNLAPARKVVSGALRTGSTTFALRRLRWAHVALKNCVVDGPVEEAPGGSTNRTNIAPEET